MESVKKIDLSVEVQLGVLKDVIKKYSEGLSNTDFVGRTNVDSILDINDVLKYVFNSRRTDRESIEKFKENLSLFRYVDLSNASFADCNVAAVDFTGLNANLDPQVVLKKNLRGCKLCGLDFSGKSFDGVTVTCCDFTGATNVNLDPQTVMFKSLYSCILNGIDFLDKSFVSVCLENADFRGAKNVIVNKHTVWNRDLASTLFDGSAVVFDEAKVDSDINELRSKLSEAFSNSKTR